MEDSSPSICSSGRRAGAAWAAPPAFWGREAP